MNAREFRSAIDEDEALVVGLPVEVRWTNCYRFYAATGHVSKVNTRSVRVTLDTGLHDRATGKVFYPAGQELVIPRLSDFRRWSANNCVHPLTR